MFSFFQTIFHKITIAVASIAVAVGLVAVPKPIEQPISIKSDVVTIMKDLKPANQESGSAKEHVIIKTVDSSKEIEVLRKEIEDLKKSKSDKPIINTIPIEVYYPIKKPESLTISAQEFINKTRLASTSTIAYFVTNLNSKISINWNSKQKELDLRDSGFTGYVYLDFICSEYNQYKYDQTKSVQDMPFKTCVLYATIDKEKVQYPESIIFNY